MFRKKLVALSMAAALCFAVPAAALMTSAETVTTADAAAPAAADTAAAPAETAAAADAAAAPAATAATPVTFTSQDGVLSINLPNEDWKQIADPTKWIALSDGNSVITIEHFSNGEKLPDMSVANEHYVNVYQAVFSTQNEVFVITGSVADTSKIPEVTSTIMSAKVLKYDTKLAVGKDKEIKASEFSIVPMNTTMYVTADSLIVRMACSTDSQRIGSLPQKSAVKVTGAVQRNGANLGWYQIAFGNGTGYVSGQFLSSSAPAAAPAAKPAATPAATLESGTVAPASPEYTGTWLVVYDEDGVSTTLYEAKDGYWYDVSGTAYIRHSETEFQVKEGMKRVSTINPKQNGPEVIEPTDGSPSPEDEPASVIEPTDGSPSPEESTESVVEPANGSPSPEEATESVVESGDEEVGSGSFEDEE